MKGMSLGLKEALCLTLEAMKLLPADNEVTHDNCIRMIMMPS